MSTVVEISAAIDKLDVKEQVELLRILPQHLKISADDLAWSRLAEPAFEFWNNPEDAIYDQLPGNSSFNGIGWRKSPPRIR
jgi:hypothetical protein